MTSGYPSDATENAVQANIVAAGYSSTSDPAPCYAGPRISLRPPPSCCTSTTSATTTPTPRPSSRPSVLQLRHRQGRRHLDRPRRAGQQLAASPSSPPTHPGNYLQALQIRALPQPQQLDLSVRPRRHLLSTGREQRPGLLLPVVNYPAKYIRHYNYTVYIASNGGANAWDSATSWSDDAELGRQHPVGITPPHLEP